MFLKGLGELKGMMILFNFQGISGQNINRAKCLLCDAYKLYLFWNIMLDLESQVIRAFQNLPEGLFLEHFEMRQVVELKNVWGIYIIFIIIIIINNIYKNSPYVLYLLYVCK